MKKLLPFFLTLWATFAQANVPCTLPFNLQNATTADATQVMANYNALVTCLTNAAAAGVNSDITNILGLTTPLSVSQGGTSSFIGGTSGGSANAQTVSVTPSTYALVTGYRGNFTAGFSNTGAATLAVNATGVLNFFNQTIAGPVAMTGGEIVAGDRVEFIYDGTQYQLLRSVNQPGGFGPLTSLASAATTDLGTVFNHNIQITGSATITSFGASASTVYPIYQLSFTGAATLTQNATSLILPGLVSIVTAANDTARALYLGSGNWQVLEYIRASGSALTVPAVRGQIAGLTLSGGGAQAVGINPGVATSDDFTTTMSSASSYTKTFANWVVGSGNGGLDTGSIATNTWYHVFEIERTDTGVVDFLISLSVSTPTLPTSYTKQRRIGSVRTDATPNVLGFLQIGDYFRWQANVLDLNAGSWTSTSALTTLTVPTGLNVQAFGAASFSASGGSQHYALLSDPFATDVAITSQNASQAADFSVVPGNTAFQVMTNTSAQVRRRSDDATGTGSITTFGWIDTRGRNN